MTHSKVKSLEKFLTDEIRKEIPLVSISQDLLFYKDIKIKKNKSGFWNVYGKTGDKVGEFKIKTTASLAAKFYHKTDLKNFNLTKILDFQYWHNATDAEFFKERSNKTKDYERRDLFTCRHDIAKHRALHYKDKITAMFRINF